MCASPHRVIILAPFVNSYTLPTMSFVKKKNRLIAGYSYSGPVSLFNTVKSSIATTSHRRPPPKSDHQSKTPKFSQ